MKFNPEKLKTSQATITTTSDLLVACYGNQTELSRLLGVSRSNIRDRLKAGGKQIIIIDNDQYGDLVFGRVSGVING